MTALHHWPHPDSYMSCKQICVQKASPAMKGCSVQVSRHLGPQILVLCEALACRV